jgi:SAM-dependent methyltransferase
MISRRLDVPSRTPRGPEPRFGTVAAAYDRYRPSYPAQLVDDLLVDPVRRVLDIGAGTGIAGELFAGRGCEVVGVEPDPAMARFAQRKGLCVLVERFEECRLDGTFDLAISAQAWHWLDQPSALDRLRALLPSGELAVFWNTYSPPDDVARAAIEIVETACDGASADSVFLGTARPGVTPIVAGLEESAEFDRVQERSYTWIRPCSLDSWLGELQTHHSFIELPLTAREQIAARLAADVGPDHRFEVVMTTSCVVASRGRRAVERDD